MASGFSDWMFSICLRSDVWFLSVELTRKFSYGFPVVWQQCLVKATMEKGADPVTRSEGSSGAESSLLWYLQLAAHLCKSFSQLPSTYSWNLMSPWHHRAWLVCEFRWFSSTGGNNIRLYQDDHDLWRCHVQISNSDVFATMMLHHRIHAVSWIGSCLLQCNFKTIWLAWLIGDQTQSIFLRGNWDH